MAKKKRASAITNTAPLQTQVHPTRGHTGGAPIPKQALPGHDNRYLPAGWQQGATAPAMAPGVNMAGGGGNGAMQVGNSWLRFGTSGGLPGQIGSSGQMQRMLNSSNNRAGGFTVAGNNQIPNLGALLGYGTPAAVGAGGGAGGGVPIRGGGMGGVAGGVGAGGYGGNGDLVSMLQAYQDQANAANEARYQEGKSVIQGGQKKASQKYAQNYGEMYGIAGQISDAAEKRATRAGESELANYTSSLYNMGLANNTGALQGRQGIIDRATERTNAAADEGLKTMLGLKGRYADTVFGQADNNRNELTSWIYNKQEEGPNMDLWSRLLSQPGATGGYGAGTGINMSRSPQAQQGGFSLNGQGQQNQQPMGGGQQPGQMYNFSFGAPSTFGDFGPPAQPFEDEYQGGGGYIPPSIAPPGFPEPDPTTTTGPDPYMGAPSQGNIIGYQQDEAGQMPVMDAGPVKKGPDGVYVSPAWSVFADQRLKTLPPGSVVRLASGMKLQKDHDGTWVYAGSN